MDDTKAKIMKQFYYRYIKSIYYTVKMYFEHKKRLKALRKKDPFIYK